jgi:hypothetical protein
MQLKLQRSQRTGGLSGSTVFFCLDVRADYDAEEMGNIARYRLGPQVIYNSRAAQRHLDAAGGHLERTQEGTVGNRLVGLARGAASMALAKLQLNMSIASLGRGHHVECKDLEELLEAEDTIRNACKNLTKYLEIAATFNGSEIVVEYEKGEEKVHVTQNAVPLLAGPGASAGAPRAEDAVYEESAHTPGAPFDLGFNIGNPFLQLWEDPASRKLVYVVAGVLALILLLRSCF